MILAKLLALRSFLSRVPWQVWAALGIVLSAWAWGNHRYGEGVEDERARWEAKIAAAEKQARKAERDAQANHDKREDTREADTDDLRNRIKDATDAHPDETKRDCGPATRAVLDGLR